MASLVTYRAKRNFEKTSEPKGRKSSAGGHRFVIQKHSARRLHYDLRLEVDGVLKSWAVTRGPSLVPGEKRLAVQVEDHPLDYASFEGTIPKGEYGGGTVIVWDEGRWTPVTETKKALTKGHLEFELDGKKLKGRWHLIRMKGPANEGRSNWLLVKEDDRAAREPGEPDILEERPESVLTGKTIEDLAEDGATGGKGGGTSEERSKKPAKEKGLKNGTVTRTFPKVAVKAALPPFIEPALARLKDKAPTGPQWVHEIKFDGYRLQARIDSAGVKLLTRGGLDWTGKFGAGILDSLRKMKANQAIIDGELVVENEFGSTDFSALQADLSEGHTDRFVFYAFDLLYLDGYDLRQATLLERKALLSQLLPEEQGALRYSEHFAEAGNLVLQHACRLSLEGVVSKMADAPYRSDRDGTWIKSKCSARQEFVIGGYVPSTVSQYAIGSLVLGVYDDGKLKHVGRVGTGFPGRTAEDMLRRLEKIAVPESPFADKLTRDEARQVRFVKPELVAEVEFRGWTGDGNLRHASFRGLREDKAAEEVVRETSGPVTKREPAKPRRAIELTHPDRVYWPDTGLTKEGLVDYYSSVWHLMGPMIVNRPLALLRCPDGINGQSFFQKHAWKGMRKEIATIQDPAEALEPFVYISDFTGLVALVQGAALEIHPWGTTIRDWERPDIITMDLDPGEGVSWAAIVSAAREVADRLSRLGLSPFVKTSGGKGLHVVSPLKPSARWPEVKSFTKKLAEAMAVDSPAAYVATISKSKRKGRILVDYLRNQRGMTAVAPYSTRARPGAPVSMPVGWEELDTLNGANQFTVANALNRVATLDKNPWAEFGKAASPLRAGLKP